MTVEVPNKPQRSPSILETIHFNGHDFECEEWKVPDTSSYKGKIICVHGLGEDSNIYGRLFDLLSNQGYEIFFYKQRLTLNDPTTVFNSIISAPKDLLVSEHEENHHVDIADLDSVIRYNLDSRMNKQEKFYLLGNGQGSSLMLCYAMMGKYQDWIKTLICFTPTVGYHEKTGPNKVIQSVTPFLTKYIPNVRVFHKVNMQYMTSDPEWIRYFTMVLYKKSIKISISQFNKMLVRYESLRSRSFMSRFNPNISVLILHGDHNYINSLEATEEMYSLFNNNIDKELHVVKGGMHMLLNDSEEIFDEVLQKTLSFLNKYKDEQYGSVYNSL